MYAVGFLALMAFAILIVGAILLNAQDDWDDDEADEANDPPKESDPIV